MGDSRLRTGNNYGQGGGWSGNVYIGRMATAGATKNDGKLTTKAGELGLWYTSLGEKMKIIIGGRWAVLNEPSYEFTPAVLKYKLFYSFNTDYGCVEKILVPLIIKHWKCAN